MEALIAVGVFGAIALPAYLAWGRTAYVLAICGSSLAILCARAYFVRRLLPGVDLRRLVARCVWPVAVAAGAVVALRLALWGGERGFGQAIAEVALFLSVYGALVVASERPLLAELRRGLGRGEAEPAAAQ